MIVAPIVSVSGLSAVDLQTATIRRRLKLSPSVARAYADHAYGDGQRSDLAQLAALTANRIASNVGGRS